MDEDEDEKFLLASESKEPSSEQGSESLDPSSVEGDLADVDSGGISEPKLGDIEGKEKECRAVIEDIRLWVDCVMSSTAETPALEDTSRTLPHQHA
ncbi:UNVERIFIED_CONTAM: hypothetical protein FKN15_054153 [Acipenser sinensis]